MAVNTLITKIDKLKSLMVAVATGGPQIQRVNDQYQTLYHEVEDFLSIENIENPNPYPDLWLWYGRWRSGDLPSYQSRREYIFNMYDPLLKELLANKAKGSTTLDIEPTGWARVDRAVDKIKAQLEKAKNEEDFQGVGLLCREALISLAQAVYDAKKHKPKTDITLSSTDANGMLEAYINSELGGGENENSRRVVKASLVLANELQHKRTASFRDAALCAQTTFTIINLVSIVSGHLHS